MQTVLTEKDLTKVRSPINWIANIILLDGTQSEIAINTIFQNF